jgi:ankyrin repeat protein
MKRGADVTVTDRCGQTALHFASKNGQVQSVKRLISCGVQIDKENKYHRTPLMLSIIYKHFDVAHLLISSGASVECLNQLDVDIGRQALTFAVMKHHLEMVRILISNGVGIKGKLNTIPPITALMWAAQNGNDMFVKQLILSGVDIDYQDEKAWTALHYAAYNNHIQCGILLAEAGADLESLNKDLLTPIKMASKEFQKAVLYTTSFNAKKAICVIGNASSGKSTLITALQNEKAPYLTQWYNWTFGVKKIQQRTAGIEPVEVKSERYGHVIFFDFAGQHEYHGPHEMFLESILNKSRSSVTIIVVVKVTEEESVILEQLD